MMFLRNLLICSALFMLFVPVDKSRAEVSVSASIGLNFNELDEYGEWVDVQGLGRVWRPDADQGWRPFMYGRWVYSNDGWLWNSDEPFGWIVCHYGNWYEDDNFGWVWMPGYEWSPARVEWYVTDNEIAWAPLYPPSYHHRFNRVHWAFCPIASFSSGEIHSHIHFGLRPDRPSVKVYVGAPRFEFVQRFGHTPIVRVTPRKVMVSNREHPLFRMEFDNHHHNSTVVVPIGRQYRREHVHIESNRPVEIPSHVEESHSAARPIEHERSRVIVEPQRQEHDQGSRVIVEPRREDRDQGSRVVVEPQHERSRVIIESHSDQPERRAKVEVRSQKDNNDNNNDNDKNNREKKRIRVDVQGN
jgi:hypothetical protein